MAKYYSSVHTGAEIDEAVSEIKEKDFSEATASFTQAASRVNIATDESLATLFGKIKKYFADLGTAAFVGIGTSASTVAKGNHTHTAADVGAASAAVIVATLLASGWQDGSQTVEAPGVMATGQAIFPSPATAADSDAWAAAGIFCAAQATNALTFTCDTPPTEDITVNLALINNAV